MINPGAEQQNIKIPGSIVFTFIRKFSTLVLLAKLWSFGAVVKDPERWMERKVFRQRGYMGW